MTTFINNEHDLLALLEMMDGSYSHDQVRDFAQYLQTWAVMDTDTLTDEQWMLALRHWQVTGITDFRTGAEPWDALTWWEPGLEREMLVDQLGLEDYVRQSMYEAMPGESLAQMAERVTTIVLLEEKVALDSQRVLELLELLCDDLWHKLRLSA